jgi:lysozyme
MSSLISGIDVSSIQGVVPWAQVAASGVQFAFIRNYVGNDGQDTLYTSNMTETQNNNILPASYNFLYPLPTNPDHPNRDPLGQAQLHFQNTNNNFPVAADVEWPAPQDFSTWGVSASFIVEWVLTYLEHYQSLSGVAPLVYIYPFYAQTLNLAAYSEFANYQLWIASYEPTPTIPAPFSNYTIWQYSSTGKLPNGAGVDLNYAQNLNLWNTNATTPSIPANSSPISNPAPVAVVPSVAPQTVGQSSNNSVPPVATPPITVSASNSDIWAEAWQTVSNVIKDI